MFGDGIAAAVDIHMQAGVEEVLVRRAAEIVIDHTAPLIGFAGGHGCRLDDAGELGFELDRAILVEIPVEAVVVIADSGEEGNNKTARAADLEDAVANAVVAGSHAQLPPDSLIRPLDFLQIARAPADVRTLGLP